MNFVSTLIVSEVAKAEILFQQSRPAYKPTQENALKMFVYMTEHHMMFDEAESFAKAFEALSQEGALELWKDRTYANSTKARMTST